MCVVEEEEEGRLLVCKVVVVWLSGKQKGTNQGEVGCRTMRRVKALVM